MRTNDPWTVAKYAPLLIDDTVYFVISAGLPAGTLRKDGIPPTMAYVNPLSDGEYFRKSDEMLERATFARAERVQVLLEIIRPNTYQAHDIIVPGDEPLICTLITRRPIMRSLLEKALPVTLPDPALPTVDQQLIQEFSTRPLTGQPVNKYAVVARLIQSPKSSRFLRLTKVLADTIWSS